MQDLIQKDQIATPDTDGPDITGVTTDGQGRARVHPISATVGLEVCINSEFFLGGRGQVVRGGHRLQSVYS